MTDKILFIDGETSTHNKGHPFDGRNFLVSYSYAFGNDNPIFKWHTDADFISCLHEILSGCDEAVGFNIKFDLHWFSNLKCFVRPLCRVYDCSLAEFILSGQQNGFISLNEALESYGLPAKKDIVAEYWEQGISTENIPKYIVEEYNNWDVTSTRSLYHAQRQIIAPKQLKLIYLEGEDLKALQSAEHAGIKFDEQKAIRIIEEQSVIVSDAEQLLSGYMPKFPDTFVFNYDSGDHLSAFLYGGKIIHEYAIPEQAVYKSGPNKGHLYTKNRWFSVQVEFPKLFEPLENSELAKTRDKEAETRFYQTDEPTLRQLRATKETKKILSELSRRSAAKKVMEMVQTIRNKIREMNWEDGYIHGQFNQNIVRTGRLSSSAPNMQNTPIEVDELLVSRYAD